MKTPRHGIFVVFFLSLNIDKSLLSSGLGDGLPRMRNNFIHRELVVGMEFALSHTNCIVESRC